MGFQRWYLEHMFIIAGRPPTSASWLQSFRKFPPRQKPGSFNLDRVMEAVTSNDGTDEPAPRVPGTRPGAWQVKSGAARRRHAARQRGGAGHGGAARRFYGRRARGVVAALVLGAITASTTTGSHRAADLRSGRPLTGTCRPQCTTATS